MTDVAALKAELAALRSVRASGARRIRFGDREVERRPDAELKAAIDDLERRIAEAERGPTRIVYIRDTKGL
jgi:hypothetical protein